MDKKTFLKELERRLSILVDSERKDIINEYKDIIEEKIKHGESEADAVASFGSIDELAKEILSAYKINYNYRSTDDSFKNIIDDCGNLIEKGARKLSDLTRGIVDDIKKRDKNFTLESAFEIILKFIVVLVLLLIARIPFIIISGILEGILRMGIAPFDLVGRVIIHSVMWIIYIIFCATICVFFFKKYIGNPVDEIKEEPKEKIKKNKKETSKDDEAEETTIAETIKSKPVSKTNDALGVILKIFAYVLFLIPIFFINLGLIIALIIVIYLMAKGVIIYQALLIIFGLLIIFSSIEDSIKRLLDNRHVYVFPFIIGFILVALGGILSIELATKFEYHNYLPTNNLATAVNKTEVTLDRPLDIDDDFNYQLIIDDTLPDDKAIVEITYYKQLVKLESYLYNVHEKDKKVLDININSVNRFSIISKIVIDNLKDNKIYNYSEFYIPTVKVYTNSNNANKIS